MSPPPLPDDERESLAAEYALGLLEGDGLASARELYRNDAAFRADVGGWLGRLAPLLDEVPPVAPPAGMWATIERGVGGEALPNNVVQLRKRLNVWRGVAAGASALAAALALVMVIRPLPQAPAPPVQQAPVEAMVAVLGDEERPGAMLASWNPATRNLTLAEADGAAVEPGRAHELWVIPADGTPRSLGVMEQRPMLRVAVPADMSQQLHQGATLAISVEPAGGSPTGLPTGPVIASGKLERA